MIDMANDIRASTYPTNGATRLINKKESLRNVKYYINESKKQRIQQLSWANVVLKVCTQIGLLKVLGFKELHIAIFTNP